MSEDFVLMMRDAIHGEDAIKARSMSAYHGVRGSSTSWTAYSRCLFIPKAYDDEEAAAMLHRAHYPHVVRRTRAALIARAFSRKYQSDADGLDDLDYDGRPLSDLMREVLSEHLLVGYSGILVDYEDAPKFIHYTAESISEWFFDRGVLKHLDLDESGFEMDGEDRVPVKRRRIYSFDEDGLLYSRLDQFDADLSEWILGDVQRPTGVSGPLSSIPFVFVGRPGSDSLLEPLARLALKYMDQSAQLNYASSKVGQPTPYIIWGIETEDLGPWQKLISEDGIKLGSSTMVQLPKGSKFGFNEFSGAGLAVFREEMAELVSMMIASGARALSDTSKGNVAPETVRMQNSGESSTLSSVVEVVEAAFNKALAIAAEFLGAGEPDTITMNRDFFDDVVTPQDILSLSQAVIAGSFPQSLFFEALRRGGWTEKTDDELEGEILGV